MIFVIINLHFAFITTQLMPLFFREGSLGFSFALSSAEPKGEAVGKTTFSLFCSKTHVLEEIMLSILSGRGERREPRRERWGRKRDSFWQVTKESETQTWGLGWQALRCLRSHTWAVLLPPKQGTQ